jgi:hypothetical protein
MKRKKLAYLVCALILVLAVIQLFPPDRTNPPINPKRTFESVAKPSPAVLSIINRSCRDCHTNSTVWPWYSRIAPVSWLVASDVTEGREHLNFSEWGHFGPEMSKEKLKQVCSEVRAGDMPLWQYTLIHSQARLSQADKDVLCSASNSIAETK